MTSKRIRKSQIIVVALILLLTSLLAAMLSAEWAVADNQVGFEIEGNTALDQGMTYDWENAMPPASLFKDPNSRSEIDSTTFRPDGKFDDPAGWSIVPGKVGPGQDELTNVMAWAVLPGDLADGEPEHTWLIMGMERTKKEGTFFLDFEFNRLAWDGRTGGPERSDGDLVVGFELKGNPTDRQKDLRIILLQYGSGLPPAKCETTWGGGSTPASVRSGSETCPPYGDSGFYYRFMGDGAMLSSSGFGEATMNEAPFPAPPWGSTDASGSPRNMIGPFQFAEAAINLSSFDIEPVCASFSSVHAKSRSSLEPNSDLKDLAGMGSFPVECSLEGYKFLDVDGDGEWDRPDERGLPGWTIDLSDGQSAVTDLYGHYKFSDLFDGSYTVSERCPSGWVQTSPGMTDIIDCGSEKHEAVTVDVENREVTDINFGDGRPVITVERSCSPERVFVGDDLYLEVTVANTGNVVLRDVEVSDTQFDEIKTIDRLAPWQTRTFTETLRIRSIGEVAGEAEASGHYGLATVTDTADTSCEVYSIPPITNVETDPTFTRQYLWSIDKGVSKSEVSLLLAQTERITYTVEVGLQEPAFEDLEFKIGGSVTISNPAPIAATFRAVAVRLSEGQSLDLRDLLTVPGGESVTINFGPVPVDDGGPLLVEAVAHFIHNHKGITVVEKTANAEFGPTPADEIDEEVTVCDDGITSLTGGLNDGSAGSPMSARSGQMIYFPLVRGGGGPPPPPPCLALGTGTVHYSEAPQVFTYSETIGPFIDGCSDVYDNTARITTCDTGTTHEDDVQVSAFMTCTLTVGFEDMALDPDDWSRGNDWDYNDAIYDVTVTPRVEAGDQLSSIQFRVHQEERTGNRFQAVYHHSLYLQPDFAPDCVGNYSVWQEGTVSGPVGPIPYTNDIPITLIPDSHDFPACTDVILSISFDSCPLASLSDIEAYDPVKTVHGEYLFLKPWIMVEDHLDTPDAQGRCSHGQDKNGKCRCPYGRDADGRCKCPFDRNAEGECRAPIPSQDDLNSHKTEIRRLVIPEDWHDWPLPCEAIWLHYPTVDKGETGPDFAREWWISGPHAGCAGGDTCTCKDCWLICGGDPRLRCGDPFYSLVCPSPAMSSIE